eukprot:TRINITY_DN1809_c0_g1_i11.p2 TRINITY_DN1809_c0_g1~~TRINITY_DN1809_c0_g1_i11.p2  ORF type:complete len:108 (+),score=19.73 TRINITY_DN1809_c0_g1_i11:551-874(+)
MWLLRALGWCEARATDPSRSLIDHDSKRDSLELRKKQRACKVKLMDGFPLFSFGHAHSSSVPPDNKLTKVFIDILSVFASHDPRFKPLCWQLSKQIQPWGHRPDGAL